MNEMKEMTGQMAQMKSQMAQMENQIKQMSKMNYMPHSGRNGIWTPEMWQRIDQATVVDVESIH